MNEKENAAKSMWLRLKELLILKFEYTRLTFAEKLTMLLAMLVICFAGLLMGMITIFFLSVALAEWIALSIGMSWSCLIVAGVYVLMMIGLFAFRKTLVINPISRFVTKMFM